MNTTFSTNLTEAEIERLVILIEEAAEVQQIASKILRHGYGSYNPFDEKKTPNRELLNKEIGDLQSAIDMLSDYHDINEASIAVYANRKKDGRKKYLHFNV